MKHISHISSNTTIITNTTNVIDLKKWVDIDGDLRTFTLLLYVVLFLVLY
jgi:hypothetical protein